MTFNHLTPFRAIAQNANKLGSRLHLVLAVLVFLGLANTASASTTSPLPGDTTLSAVICANETYLFNDQLLDTAGIYTAIFEAADGSDSTVTLVLEVFPTIITKLNAGICEGINYVFQGDTITEAGLYSAILESVNGCDSIVQLQLTVVSYFDIQQTATICDGKTFAFAGQMLSDAGVYVDSLTAIGGCDSIVTLTLSILPVPITTINVGICEGSSYVFQGDTLSSGGLYDYVFPAANGCDSIVILDLSVVTSFETTAEATICNGETYGFGAEELTDEGVYSNTFTAIGGCDSLVTLTLTVLPTQNSAVEATICDGETFTYNGTALTDPGLYEYILTGENGCDSTVLLTLNVLPIPNTVIEASICSGDSYDFNDETYSDEGVYEQIFTAASGCDSVVSLILTVLPVSFTELEVTICNGETYDFNGEILDISGVYNQLFVSANGCDSTVTLNLIELPVLESTLNVTICAGESYEFDGAVITDAGTYTATLAGTNSCDSTVTLNLEVLPTQSTNLEVSICNGTIYSFQDSLLTDAGTYTAVLTGVNGCDSTVTLVLSVLPTQTTNITAIICAGDGYAYNGLSLTDAGSYEFIYAGENGCDSTVIIQITVLPVSETALSATICAGRDYDYNGELLTQDGVYEFVFDAVNGCDSIVTLTLTVLPLSSANLSVTLCSGSSYEFDGLVLTDSGTYTSVAAGANGCDSTTTLQLTFVMEFVTNLEASICLGEEYEFNGEILNVDGVYSDTLSAVGGCDSLVTLTLAILPLSQSVTDVAICAGETYSFNGDLLADAGTYTATLTGVNGCDSTAVLNLSVLPLQTTSLSITTCANQPYSFNGLSLDQSGNYTAVLTSLNGCDSTVMLQLTVLPIVSSSLSATICAGDQYDFDGNALTQTGTYSATFEAVNGCDSLVTLQLTVLPLAQSGTAAVVCEGGPFEYNGQVFTQSGTYTFNFPGAGANGCDSIETLFLTIFPIIPVTNVSATICSGESYVFDGDTLDASGTYTTELASATGCDSVVVLQLSVLQSSETVINAVICQGGSIVFEGQVLTDAGTYTVVYSNVNGCDSTILLVLAVFSVNTNVTQQGGTLTAQAANAQYQWIDCATNLPISGANSSSFTPTVTGQYAVIVTSVFGCTGQSDCKLVQVVSVGEPLSQADWRIQPNPASQLATVVLNEAVEGELQVEVYDPAGRLLRQLSVASGTSQVALELTDFPDGMLLVRLVSDRGTSSKLLMKAGR